MVCDTWRACSIPKYPTLQPFITFCSSSLDNARPSTFSFPLLSVLMVWVPVQVYLIPVLGIPGFSAGHLTSIQAAIGTPRPGAERDECLDDGVHQIHDYGDHRVGDDQALAGTRQLHPQAAVDDAQDQPDSSPPYMRMAENAAAASLGELRVVDEAESRLDREHADHDSTELDVSVREELRTLLASPGRPHWTFHQKTSTHHSSLLRAVHAEAKASPHQQPAHHLPAYGGSVSTWYLHSCWRPRELWTWLQRL